jgi:triphosphoribosyl-dephospho-CoA synthetase
MECGERCVRMIKHERIRRVNSRMLLSLCCEIAIHRAFVARNLSPGGCGDLLAMTLFVDHLEY